MAKTLLYRLFGIGKLSPELIGGFGREGVLFSDEGVRGTVTYKDFRGGGRISNWRRQWFGGAIVLTHQRLVAYRFRHPVIDVPLDDSRLRKIEFSLEGHDTFVAAFDAGLFQPDWKGRIEYRFRTPVADGILEHLKSLGN